MRELDKQEDIIKLKKIYDQKIAFECVPLSPLRPTSLSSRRRKSIPRNKKYNHKGLPFPVL